MDSVHDTPKGWVAPFGYPRIKACSRLPMAFRSVPRPSSPPGAKASTECPSHTRYTSTGSHQRTHHAQKPSSDCPVRTHMRARDTPKIVPAGTLFAHNRILPDQSPNARSRGHRITNQTVSFTRL